ncbi:DUF4240 domain-containing protein [Pseudoflavitalea sp. X16]|uniref:DUF4240 domain-containing protein n=1 Tax=Paraflavitalea devenefica TaxID=2716334 RepID=UPI00141F3ED0|nr:DUF4240 domain-containing protein [Paraflavitalea devenefica]NII28236.1 DUF4240 domain-containing protein [Paraflavitalea devenefica]
MQVLYIILTALIFIILIRLLFRKVLDLPAYSGKLLTDNSSVDNLMPEGKFWEIIHETKKSSNRRYQIQCQLLTEHLNNLSGEEIIQFDRTFSFLMAKSYSYKLWEPAYALNGGCSDDCFEYFRSWLIGQGKNTFYWTTKYPRVLFLVGVKELIENYEGIAYCAYEAYQYKTGQDLPERQDIQYSDGGEVFKEGEAFLRYPELALLAW